MLAGTLFQMNWNPIPDNMESEYKIAITYLFMKKHVVRAVLKEGRHLTTVPQTTGSCRLKAMFVQSINLLMKNRLGCK
ncbi:hypothetical protein HMPREF1991_02957 [Hoylesella loescheii DSM 19665 = JCM 12249 = ATCC 15930]|uniref:Uncharacterized protein n=1 Tax=Hoylesella loescheii DSM 19665 = JCM 12249 = ATCC 15930 TaxID=1122985 RepID=A0A069QDN3_HOYLO|nr:hypothetical protein HMPREF1991_02957 [Hoylesella loescheii DSM 19665 = JCM 12249 = ATCC 15930]